MRQLALVTAAVLLAAASVRISPVRAQQPGTIRITGPSSGATVNAPVSLSVEIGGVPVKPAAEGDPNAYHYHILVDVDPATVVQAGQPIPTGREDIIHTASASMPLPNLAPGAHTITVVLTRTDHVPLSPSVQDRVQFTVAAPGQPAPATGQAAPPAGGGGAGGTPVQPRTGTGLAGRDARLPRWALPLGLAALGGGLLLIRRRRLSNG